MEMHASFPVEAKWEESEKVEQTISDGQDQTRVHELLIWNV